MSTDTLDTPTTADPTDGAAPLVQRLVTQHGARWIGRAQLEAFLAEPGDRVLFFHGDPVRFPEVVDVAVVLPELQRAVADGTPGGRFQVGVVPRADEDALAARFDVQRWPSLLFLRDGRYVTVVAGMLDWLDYVARVNEALALPATRTPGIGVRVVRAGAGDAAGCR
ncbi:hydrogenase [Ideonella sp. DXS22W]|uniref:Hydrogenase n=1 Tax=Pseudaquabacterium inlustre TaxID=2984192 RepID=A0ABU9CN03_9BURK